jgi:hypothetical protein
MAVTGTVGRERPSGLIRDDEGNHGGIGEGVVGESFELGTTSALGAPLGPRDDHVVAGERGLCASEPRRSDELAASCGHLGGSWRDAPVGPVEESAVTLSRVTPSARARWAQVSRSSTSSTSSLSRLVFRHAASLALGPDRPVRSSSASIAFLRCEKLRSTSRLKALELGQAAPVRHEPLATELGDALAKLGAIDRSRRASVQVDHAGVESGPSPVASFYNIADDPMRMELRIELTRGGVDEAGDGEPRRDVPVAAPEPAPCPAALVLEEREGRLDRPRCASASAARSGSSASAQASDTDFGAESVKSQPGVWSVATRSNSRPPSGCSPFARARNAAGSTAPTSPSDAAAFRASSPPRRARRRRRSTRRPSARACARSARPAAEATELDVALRELGLTRERRADVSCEITGGARRRISAGWFLVAHFRRSFLGGRRRFCAQGLTALLTATLTATLTGGEILRGFPVPRPPRQPDHEPRRSRPSPSTHRAVTRACECCCE